MYTGWYTDMVKQNNQCVILFTVELFATVNVSFFILHHHQGSGNMQYCTFRIICNFKMNRENEKSFSILFLFQNYVT